LNRQVCYRWMAFITALAVVPPSGWCCLVRPCCSNSQGAYCRQEAGPYPGQQPSCCQSRQVRSRDGQARAECAPHAPLSHSGRCCCSRDVTAPERDPLSVQGRGKSALKGFHLGYGSTSYGDETSLLSRHVRVEWLQFPPLRSGPRLHVVKCLWRC